MREKFVFLSNFKDAADKLPDDMRLRFYDAMTDYVFKGIDPDDAVVAALVGAIKPSLDIEDKRGGMREGAGRKSKEIKNNQKNQNDYFEKIENQKKSNEIKNNQNDQKEKKTPLNPEKNKNIYIPENNKLFSAPSNDDGTIDLEELIAKTPPKQKSKPFTPPTLEDVKAYIAERGCAAVVDAKKFFDYFEAGRWHDSEGKPVRSWKQKLITWETHGRQTRTLKAAQGLLGVKSGTYAEDVPL